MHNAQICWNAQKWEQIKHSTAMHFNWFVLFCRI